MAKGLIREEERNNRAVERDKQKRRKNKKTYVIKRKNVFRIKHFKQYMYEFDVHL